MKKLIFLLGFLFLSSMLFSQTTEDDNNNRRWSGSLALGASVLNSNHQIDQLFQDYRFADDIEGWFRNTRYPQKFTLPSLEIEFAYLFSPNMEAAGSFMAGHSSIRGYNGNLDDRLEITSTNFRFYPSLKIFTNAYQAHFQVGPSINIGEFYRTELSNRTVPYSERYVRIGVMAGAGFSIFENTNSFLRIAVNYHVLPNKVNIGPFEYLEDPNVPPKNQVIIEAIPKEEVLVQELVIKAIYGFKFETN